MIEFAPGETKNVQFKVNEKMLQFYTANKKWESKE
jgi:beta-glucosidase